MTAIKYALAIEAYTPRLEDRAQVIPVGDFLLIAVADGVGGRSGGAAAAQAVMQLARDAAAKSQSQPGSSPPTAAAWLALLEAFDRTADADDAIGQTTAVVATVSATQVQGASAGDSAAWLIAQNDIRDLTRHQRQKPFLGIGQAVVTPFASALGGDTLLIATDGLLKYTDRQTIASIARTEDLDAAARSLIDAVRLRSGKLQDDVAVVLCRAQHSI